MTHAGLLHDGAGPHAFAMVACILGHMFYFLQGKETNFLPIELPEGNRGGRADKNEMTLLLWRLSAPAPRLVIGGSGPRPLLPVARAS
jgi:hypothetical protein